MVCDSTLSCIVLDYLHFTGESSFFTYCHTHHISIQLRNAFHSSKHISTSTAQGSMVRWQQVKRKAISLSACRIGYCEARTCARLVSSFEICVEECQYPYVTFQVNAMYVLTT